MNNIYFEEFIKVVTNLKICEFREEAAEVYMLDVVKDLYVCGIVVPSKVSWKQDHERCQRVR